MEDVKLDVLACGAHPDDVEIMAGGTIAKLKKQGYAIGILDCTRGEASTYGTVEEREQEADEAARILNIDVRINLELPDGALENTAEMRIPFIRTLRRFRPEIVFAPVTKTRHPDHAACGMIAHDSVFKSGLASLDTGQEPFRPSAIIYYPELFYGIPDFAVDITEEWETKLLAIKAHVSQVYDENNAESPKTLIKSREFLERVESKARYYGGVCGTRYAEPFYYDGIPVIHDIVDSFKRILK